jgi:hypothetical protein
MEKFYRSKSGLYTGSIVGVGKARQCLLDEKSKGLLAHNNFKLARKQNKPR